MSFILLELRVPIIGIVLCSLVLARTIEERQSHDISTIPDGIVNLVIIKDTFVVTGFSIGTIGSACIDDHTIVEPYSVYFSSTMLFL